ncbi:MAG: hypothetical protein V3R76_00330 [Gammaproteobacteria bacterium]
MGQMVIPIISQLIVSVVVSKVATAVAQKVGLSDSMASLIGLGAGMYAGSMVGGQSTGKVPGETADLGAASQFANPPGQDLSMPTGPAPGAQAGLTDPGGMGPGGTLPIGGTPPTPNPPPPSPATGMLNQGAPSAVPDTPASTVKSSGPDAAKTYWQRLLSPERLGDMAVAGIGGMAKQNIAKEAREYPESVKRKNAADWVAQDSPGQSRLAPYTGPGQGYLSSYQ